MEEQENIEVVEITFGKHQFGDDLTEESSCLRCI